MPDHEENQDEALHGGKRPGAGRPRGSVNRRTSALREAIELEGVDPAVALVRIGKAAEARAVAVTGLLNEVITKATETGIVSEDLDQEIARKLAEARAELSLAAECYGKVLPFVHAKPRTSADAHPEEAVEFAKAMLSARIEAAAKTLDNPTLADRLARAKAKIMVHTGGEGTGDGNIGLSFDVTPAATVIEAQAVTSRSAGPTTAQAAAVPPAPAPEPYRPVLPREAPPASADWAAPAAPWPERPAFADLPPDNPYEAHPYTGGFTDAYK